VYVHLVDVCAQSYACMFVCAAMYVSVCVLLCIYIHLSLSASPPLSLSPSLPLFLSPFLPFSLHICIHAHACIPPIHAYIKHTNIHPSIHIHIHHAFRPSINTDYLDPSIQTYRHTHTQTQTDTDTDTDTDTHRLTTANTKEYPYIHTNHRTPYTLQMSSLPNDMITHTLSLSLSLPSSVSLLPILHVLDQQKQTHIHSNTHATFIRRSRSLANHIISMTRRAW